MEAPALSAEGAGVLRAASPFCIGALCPMDITMPSTPKIFRGWRFAVDRTGSNRLVVLFGPIAIKFARSLHGRKACLLERAIWAHYGGKPGNGELLCPILWSDRHGRCVVMRIAEPIPAHREAEWAARCSAWHYSPGNGNLGDPSERCLSNWGLIDGRIVMIDYGNVKPE